MINFMTNVLAEPKPAISTETPTWAARWARFWQRHERVPSAATRMPTVQILDLVDRVRGLEAQMARAQMERTCRERR